MESKNMTIKEVLIRAKELLENAKVEDALLKARIILSKCILKPKEYLFIHENEELNLDIQKVFFSKIDKLSQNTPLQYITNEQEFMGLKFYVDENVLIPRDDTEVLVEQVVKYIKSVKNVDKVLELCTGSGIIAISLSKICDNINITATDISKDALNIAKKNTKINQVENRIKFINTNMFENINGKYDVIISNPPYIETNVINSLSKDVQNEPKLALDGGESGLEFYKIIAENANRYLNRNGKIFVEIGYNQKESVTRIFKKYFKNVDCIKDYNNLDRVIIAK